MFGVNFLVMAWPKWGGKLVGWVERFLLSCINCMSWVGLSSVPVMLCFDADYLSQHCGLCRSENAKDTLLLLLMELKRRTVTQSDKSPCLPYSNSDHLIHVLSREEREPECAGAVLWTGMVSCGGGGVEVAHAPTCNWTLQPSLHVWVFVVLIKIGGWGNVQVVDEIPPTANQLVEKWQKPAQVDKIGSGRTLHLIVNPVFTSFSA